MPDLRIPGPARRILLPLAREAARRRLPLYLAGGCVRDWLLGLAAADLDVVAEGDPSPLAGACARLLGAPAERFGQFGTIRVVGKRFRVDLAASRKETYPEPAALPRVSPAPIAEDLRRRDFTINALAAPLGPRGAGEILDPLGGLEDLASRVVRALHPASFRDDPTRVFRAARYSCRLRYRLAPDLAAMAREALRAGFPQRLSRHRLASELWRVLAEHDPLCAVKRLRGWGYLELLHPRLGPPPPGLKAPGERLAAMALALGPEDGLAFLRSLPLERPVAAPIAETLRLAGERRAPREKPSPLAARVLAAVFPRLSPAALRPLLVDGGDLASLGVPPGKDYGTLLGEAAGAQWSGRFSSRSGALAWLKARARAAKSR